MLCRMLLTIAVAVGILVISNIAYAQLAPQRASDLVTLRACQEIIESTFERVVYGFTTCLSYRMLW
jgi:hypothetical protein